MENDEKLAVTDDTKREAAIERLRGGWKERLEELKNESGGEPDGAEWVMEYASYEEIAMLQGEGGDWDGIDSLIRSSSLGAYVNGLDDRKGEVNPDAYWLAFVQGARRAYEEIRHEVEE